MKLEADSKLQAMVHAHYDNSVLMKLEGEIHFDEELSAAEVDIVMNAYQTVSNNKKPSVVYAPCAGTLRHIPHVLKHGVDRVIAVDLSAESLRSGQEHYGHLISQQAEIYNTDIRNVEEFAPESNVDLAYIMGNSFGDVTDLEGHLEFIRALAKPLRPGGILVFDYVGPRYNPKVGTVVESVWPETLNDNGTRTPVIDRRTRTFTPTENGMGLLQFTCEVKKEDGTVLVPNHPYEKLVVPDDLLIEQFASAGLNLRPLGPIKDISPYHAKRIMEKDDLGMMGKPDNVYLAVKQ